MARRSWSAAGVVLWALAAGGFLAFGPGAARIVAQQPATGGGGSRRAAAPPAAPSDTWTDPNPGIRHLQRVIPSIPCVVHVMVVDLTAPGVHIRITPYPQRWSTVSEYARRNHLAGAINGGFWGFMQRPLGLAAGGGQLWPTSRGDDDEHAFFAVEASGRAWISVPTSLEETVDARRAAEAVSGRPVLVQDGQVSPEVTSEPQFNSRHPRTAIGVSRDGHTVYLIAADGRQAHSRGLRLPELARFLIDTLHVWRAINLDGGGSTTMYLASEGGVVNVPSGGRWDARLGLAGRATKRPSQIRTREDGTTEYFVRGIEREVMNHIGVIAPAGHAGTTGSVPTGTGRPGSGSDPDAHPATTSEAREGDVTYVVEQPDESSWQLGQSREILYPLAFGGGILFVVGITVGGTVWVVRRRRRSRAKRRQLQRAAAATPAPTPSPA